MSILKSSDSTILMSKILFLVDQKKVKHHYTQISQRLTALGLRKHGTQCWKLKTC